MAGASSSRGSKTRPHISTKSYWTTSRRRSHSCGRTAVLRRGSAVDGSTGQSDRELRCGSGQGAVRSETRSHHRLRCCRRRAIVSDQQRGERSRNETNEYHRQLDGCAEEVI